jgi:hypothetical protein
LSLGWRLFRNKAGFSPRTYTENLNVLHRDRFGHIEGQKQIGQGSAVRLSSPVAVAPFEVPAKVQAKPVKQGSVAGCNLPSIPLVHFEPNQKGGIEAWYRPSRQSSRSDRVYLCYIGKRTLERLAQEPDRGESSIENLVRLAAEKKNVVL